MAPRGPIAQLAEHRADNAGVSGAIPLRPISSARTISLFEQNRATLFDSDTLLGPVAQLGERLICIQEVSGSIPLRST